MVGKESGGKGTLIWGHISFFRPPRGRRSSPLTHQPSFRLQLPGSSMCNWPHWCQDGPVFGHSGTGEILGWPLCCVGQGPYFLLRAPLLPGCHRAVGPGTDGHGSTQLSFGPQSSSFSLRSVQKASDLLIASFGLPSVFKSEELKDQFCCKQNWSVRAEEHRYNRCLKEPVHLELFSQAA